MPTEKERTEKVRAFQVFQMGCLLCVQVFVPCKREDTALLAGNTDFGLQDACMTDCLAAGLTYGDPVSFRMIEALHTLFPICRFRL